HGTGSSRPFSDCDAPSAPVELRRPLLEEGREPLLRVLRGEREVDRASLVVEPEGQAALERAVDGLLREPGRDGRIRGDVERDAPRLVEPRLARDDTGDEPGLERLARGEAATAQDHVHRERLSDRAREPLGPAGAGDDPDPRLRLAEHGRLRRDDQVARHRELAAAAEAVARDGGDERRPELADRVPALDPALVVDL